MISTIVEDRRFEMMLIELKRPPKTRGCCGQKQRHSIHDVLSHEAPTSDVADEDAATDGKSKAKRICCGLVRTEEPESEVLNSEQVDLRQIFENRKVRLDDLVKLMYVAEDKDFAKKKRLGIAAARVQSSAARKALEAIANEKTPAGFLVFTVHKCMGLLTADMVTPTEDTHKVPAQNRSLPNPYVCLELEQWDPATGEPMVTIYRTNEKLQTANPTWDEEGDTKEFTMPVWDISETKLYMHVYDKQQRTQDAFVGEAKLETPELLRLITDEGHSRKNERLSLHRCSQPSKSQVSSTLDGSARLICRLIQDSVFHLLETLCGSNCSTVVVHVQLSDAMDFARPD